MYLILFTNANLILQKEETIKQREKKPGKDGANTMNFSFGKDKSGRPVLAQ